MTYFTNSSPIPNILNQPNMVGAYSRKVAILVTCLAYPVIVPSQKFEPSFGPDAGILRSTANQSDSVDARLGPQTVPKAYIVELDAGTSLAGRSVDGHARFHKRAGEENVEYEVRQEFDDTSLFYGVSIELSNDVDKTTLEALPEVKRIWPVLEVLRPVPSGFEDLDIGGPVAPEYGYNTSVIRGENYKIDYNLKMAGVEHLHSHGFRGKGVKVAIIDTGVDYRHPALGGGFGPGKKIAFGRNYIDDGQGGPEDPIATCSSGGHGSHVAGK